MDPWKNGVSVLPVRLGLKKLWCREALAVYVKGSGGAAAEEPTPGRTYGPGPRLTPRGTLLPA